MASFWMLRHVTLVITDVSEKLSASIIRVTRIGELGMLEVTRNRRTLRRKKLSLYLTTAPRRKARNYAITHLNFGDGF
jgi:hypothetical protein